MDNNHFIYGEQGRIFNIAKALFVRSVFLTTTGSRDAWLLLLSATLTLTTTTTTTITCEVQTCNQKAPTDGRLHGNEH